MPVTVSASPPPKKTAATKPSATPGLSKKTKERAEGLQGIGQLLSAGLLFARQHADAGAVYKFWPDVAVESAKIADDNAKFGEFLDSLTAVGPYAGLITAALPLVMQVMVNHDKMDVTNVANLGCVSKETLKANVQTQIMAAEMAAMRENMEMEQERARLAEEYRTFAESVRESVETEESPDRYRAHP